MNLEHKEILDSGVEVWNAWRRRDRTQPDLSSADLSKRNFTRFNFGGTIFYDAVFTESLLVRVNMMDADLTKAVLDDCHLAQANLSGATLYQASCIRSNFKQSSLYGANLKRANLTSANLCEANLLGADLIETNLSEANLKRANMTGVCLNRANLRDSDLEGCRVHGISVWNVSGVPKNQNALIVTAKGELELTVDDLEMAQFIHLLIKNDKIRKVIDNMVQKAVLILGRFTKEHLVILDTVKTALRQKGYLPIIFRFDGPDSRDLIETVSTIAHLARFIVADLSSLKAVSQELQAILPTLLSVPVVLIVSQADVESLKGGMWQSWLRYPVVLKTVVEYNSKAHLLEIFKERIIDSAEQKVSELRQEAKDIEKRWG